MKLQSVASPGTRTPARVNAIVESMALRLKPAWLQVQLIYADDRLLRRLNREYRGKDKTTDVLSFRYEESPRPEAHAPHAEIYVSIPQARRQARQRRHPLYREVVLLVLHGLLHLQGHDHETRLEARKMRRAEWPHVKWLQQRWQWPSIEPLVSVSQTREAERWA